MPRPSSPWPPPLLSRLDGMRVTLPGQCRRFHEKSPIGANPGEGQGPTLPTLLMRHRHVTSVSHRADA